MKKYERQGGVQNTDFDGIFQHMGEERLTKCVPELEMEGLSGRRLIESKMVEMRG